MSKSNPEPTIKYTPLELNGKTYELCFDYSALAKAEAELIKSGRECNLLQALVELNMSNVIYVLYAAMQRKHKVSLSDVEQMINVKNVYTAVNAIQQAWMDSVPDPTKDTVKEKNDQPDHD